MIDGIKTLSIKFSFAVFLQCLLFLVTFHAYWAFKINPQTDEGCYLKSLTTFLFQTDPGLCNRENYFALGTAFTWIPAGWFALKLSHFFELPLIKTLVPVTAVYSHFLMVGVLFFLFEISKILFESHTRLRAFFILLNMPILYYACQRPLMSHTAELLWATFTLYFCLRKNFLLAAIGAFLTVFTRYNDFPILVVVLAYFYPQIKQPEKKLKLSLTLGSLLGAAIVGIVFYKAFITGYGGFTFFELASEFSFDNLNEMLFGFEWGVFWMSPLWPMTLILSIFIFKKISTPGKACLFWMLTELGIYSFWGGSGGDFGHRYLMGSFIGCFVLLSELENLWPTFDIWSKRFHLYGALMTTYLFAVYKTSLQMASIEFREKLGIFNPFIILAIRHLFDFNMWNAVALQNFPLYEVWISIYSPEHYGDWFYLSGFDLLWLQAVCLCTLGFVALYSLVYLVSSGVKKMRFFSRELLRKPI